MVARTPKRPAHRPDPRTSWRGWRGESQASFRAWCAHRCSAAAEDVRWYSPVDYRQRPKRLTGRASQQCYRPGGFAVWSVGVLGWPAGVGAAGGCCPPEPAAVLAGFEVPSGCLLGPVVMTADRTGLAQAGASDLLMRGAVLVVGLFVGPSAGGGGAGGLQDPGEVAELDPGIMSLGLKLVVAGAGEVFEHEYQVPGGPGVPGGASGAGCGGAGEVG